MSASSVTRWRRVEFEDSRLDIATYHGNVTKVLRKRTIGSDVLPVVQRPDTGDVGVWDRNVWIPMRWVWRALWRNDE